MQAVRGVYRGGIVELLETPDVSGEVEVVVTFLGAAEGSTKEDVVMPAKGRVLDDFEPIVPRKSVSLSDLVSEGRE